MIQQSSKLNWSSLTFYTEMEIFPGLVRYPAELRLSDFLNLGGIDPPDARQSFLEVIDPSFIETDRKVDAHILKYVNKMTVQMVGLSDGNGGRGLGAGKANKVYPFVVKVPARVGLRLPSYVITGCMHYSSGQSLHDVLSSSNMFLPLTDVAITFLRDGVTSIKPFVAVNRSQILFSQEVED
jgi:hypothetical protein